MSAEQGTTACLRLPFFLSFSQSWLQFARSFSLVTSPGYTRESEARSRRRGSEKELVQQNNTSQAQSIPDSPDRILFLFSSRSKEGAISTSVVLIPNRKVETAVSSLPSDLMAGFASVAYRNIFRKTSTYVAVAVFSAFFFERGAEALSDGVYDWYNPGVSLFSHVLCIPLTPVLIHRNNGKTSNICMKSSRISCLMDSCADFCRE